jgi:hypothetical protein
MSFDGQLHADDWFEQDISGSQFPQAVLTAWNKSTLSSRLEAGLETSKLFITEEFFKYCNFKINNYKAPLSKRHYFILTNVKCNGEP